MNSQKGPKTQPKCLQSIKKTKNKRNAKQKYKQAAHKHTQKAAKNEKQTKSPTKMFKVSNSKAQKAKRKTKVRR